MQQQTVGAYQIHSELARGAMGVVYRGFDPALARPVAIKVLLAQNATEEDLSRFNLEAMATAKLRHPNIVAIQSAGAAHGRPYLVMDLIAGGSIKQRIKERGPFGELEATRMVEKLARALDYAHSLGVLHRDVKPHNILIDERGDPLLTDFGLAKVLGRDTQITLSGDIQGTPVYMPPEQALGEREKIGPCSDIYSLGATLYEMLTGEPPFEGTTVVSVLTNVITNPPIAVSSRRTLQHPELEAICLRCLAKEPGDRYRSAADMADALRDVVRNAELAATGAGPPPKTTALKEHPAPTGSAKLVVGGLIIAGLAAGGIAWGVHQTRGALPPAERPTQPPETSPEPEPPTPEDLFEELQSRIRAHLANEEIAEARKAFDGAKVPGEASAAWLMLGAEIGYAEFDYDGAIKACNAAYGVDRELKDLFWTRGRARLQLHPDSLDGIDDLQHAIELGLDTIDARLTLARALIETESATNDEQALKILDEKAFESETPDIQGRAASLRGLYWSLQAVRAEASAIWTARNNALEEAQRALLYAPKSSRVLARCGGLRLALALTPKNKEEALENLATACTLNPRDPMPYRLRGLYYGRNETYVKAQADLEAAIDRGAQDADVYFILTYATVKNLSSQNGLAVKAEAYSKRLLVLAPERPKAHYWHGLAVAKQNRLPGGTAAGRASAKRELDAYYREARGEEKRKARKKLKRVYRDMGFAPPD